MYISPGEHENIYCVGIDRDTECKKSQTLHTEFSGFYLQLAQLAFIFVYYFIYFFIYSAQAAHFKLRFGWDRKSKRGPCKLAVKGMRTGAVSMTAGDKGPSLMVAEEKV